MSKQKLNKQREVDALSEQTTKKAKHSPNKKRTNKQAEFVRIMVFRTKNEQTSSGTGTTATDSRRCIVANASAVATPVRSNVLRIVCVG